MPHHPRFRQEKQVHQWQSLPTQKLGARLK